MDKEPPMKNPLLINNLAVRGQMLYPISVCSHHICSTLSKGSMEASCQGNINIHTENQEIDPIYRRHSDRYRKSE